MGYYKNKCIRNAFRLRRLFTIVINEICNSGHISEGLTKSILVTLPKGSGVKECEFHRRISLMGDMTKLMMRIQMNNVRSRIRPGIGQEQRGFV